jgi:hypothetical protein
MIQTGRYCNRIPFDGLRTLLTYNMDVLFLSQIFSLYVTGSINTIISPEHRHEILRYIYNHQVLFLFESNWINFVRALLFFYKLYPKQIKMQNEDGGWSTHVLTTSTMLGSCLNYAALRLLGEVAHREEDALSKGRAWILSHGSAAALPQWGKIWLSVWKRKL